MNILDKIIAQKKLEVAQRKAVVSTAELEKEYFFSKETLSLKQFMLDPNKTGIIAEFKRKSPSKGIINQQSTVEEVTMAYTQYGASGLSVLTDESFFGGALNDLTLATINEIPILRKDFMIDDYQLVEAKAFGAEVILLIAACLSPLQVKQMASTAKSLGLEVLLEIHNEAELEHICTEVDLVGVNNRNLKNFEVSIDISLQLIQQIPSDKIAVAESGINNVNTILTLQQAGFKGFLIGEHFMKEASPSIAFADFVKQLKQAQNAG
ncbi:MAG: indole-3-glycerol phosphate synthase TrpC [Sphingobacteriia bacterium]|nr:MAG: indole-3-glycerol phosphate synthase TrpC [Sphingobacteriia bacterium]TAG30461.1 MAG: indole-3-glycerol phosphate synthase TrpC [Sphingobacteriia bacterium]TAH06517.1 MAG: indole-3-glycerol phosphate synthase TrpC [Sphingobacteriia bacterium]